MKLTISSPALGAVALLASTSPAFAHADVVRSSPAANATIDAPRQVAVTFNEKIVPAFAKLEISMVGHDMTVPVKTQVSADGKTLIGVPQGRFMEGSYTIRWAAAGADGHRMSGTIPFKVR
jgi:methionine-rich copper-binding protein CopC